MRFLLFALVVALALAATGAAATGSSSPRWIVFAGFNPAAGRQTSQLFRIHTNGSGMRQLTVGQSSATQPAFAPDGQRIVFARQRFGLFVVDIAGRGLRRLTRGSEDEYPTWSPDGSRIAFVGMYEHLVGKQRVRERRLFVMTANGTAVRPLLRAPSEVGRPSWTPDGKALVLPAGSDHAALYQVDARDGRVERELDLRLDASADLATPALSPDGRTLAYVDYRPEPPGCQGIACEVFAIYLGRVPNGSRHRVHPIGDYIPAAAPGWSPDGRQIVFAADGALPSGGAVALQPLAGGATKLIGTGAIIASSPTWQPR